MTKAIQIDHISKRYNLFHENQAGYSTLVETLSSMGKSALNRLKKPFEKQPNSLPNIEEFWALKDVSFDIEEGDRVGIIGRNGAGKSTLLKILSRITEPTEGQVKIRGRLTSLIEVGTGFHQELTGRENIYLNGAILGMKHKEIKQKFDEIVAFSEVEKFLDTPVKRYSSGMYMRLGFSVAAHLDSEILIIDEVLAVGDTQFQQKCFKKLNELGVKGRTVIFVSHDIGAVLSLCNKGIFLDKGHVVASGDVNQCVNTYMKSFKDRPTRWVGAIGDEHIRIYQASIEGDKEYYHQSESPKVEIEFEVLKPHPDLFIGIGIWNMRHQLLARSSPYESMDNWSHISRPGRQRLAFPLDAGLFHEGEYLIKLHCAINHYKRISEDDIILKFPVYADPNNRGKVSKGNDGVLLGNRWQMVN